MRSFFAYQIVKICEQINTQTILKNRSTSTAKKRNKSNQITAHVWGTIFDTKQHKMGSRFFFCSRLLFAQRLKYFLFSVALVSKRRKEDRHSFFVFFSLRCDSHANHTNNWYISLRVYFLDCHRSWRHRWTCRKKKFLHDDSENLSNQMCVRQPQSIKLHSLEIEFTAAFAGAAQTNRPCRAMIVTRHAWHAECQM